MLLYTLEDTEMPDIRSNRAWRVSQDRASGHVGAVHQFNALFPGLPSSRPSNTPPWQNPAVQRMRGWSATAPHLAPAEYLIERLN